MQIYYIYYLFAVYSSSDILAAFMAYFSFEHTVSLRNRKNNNNMLSATKRPCAAQPNTAQRSPAYHSHYNA